MLGRFGGEGPGLSLAAAEFCRGDPAAEGPARAAEIAADFRDAATVLHQSHGVLFELGVRAPGGAGFEFPLLSFYPSKPLLKFEETSKRRE